jgi:integrase/recombinase XerD
MLIETSKRQVSGPLSGFAAGFADELGRQGYGPSAIGHHLSLLAHLNRWLRGRDLGADELNMTEVERFLLARRAAGYTRRLSIKALQPTLAYLRGLGVAPTPPLPTPRGPVEKMLERYRSYLTVERGLGGATARGYVDAVRFFLQGRTVPDGLALDLSHLTAADVISFVVGRCPHQGHSAARLTVSALRSLLGFLHVEGEIERSLACAVPSVACRRLAGLPKGLDPDQVQRLLASCRLGLRAVEVAKLALQSIGEPARSLCVVKQTVSNVSHCPRTSVKRWLCTFTAAVRRAPMAGRYSSGSRRLIARSAPAE